MERFRPTPENIQEMRGHIGEGLNNLEIAERLHCSLKTVDNYQRKFIVANEDFGVVQDGRIGKILRNIKVFILLN